MVFRFDTGEGLLREIIVAPKLAVPSFFGKNAYCGGTTNVVLEDR